MKRNRNLLSFKSLTLFLVFLFLSNVFFAQTEPKPDEVEQENEKPKKKDKKRRDEFKVFAGVNINQLSIASESYTSEIAPGFLLGASYKRGRFFYWEIGARYNNPVYNLTPVGTGSYSDGLFSVRTVDIPITIGINILSITSRIVGLRAFVGAVPAFALGIGDNDIGVSMDDINTFNVYGQGGIGLDVAFLFLEGGLNYGFTDMFKNDIKSNPYQIFLNLGFRF